jgi:predicted RNA-binding Zn-ribbon protein involved in translation (DUF1610 family)
MINKIKTWQELKQLSNNQWPDDDCMKEEINQLRLLVEQLEWENKGINEWRDEWIKMKDHRNELLLMLETSKKYRQGCKECADAEMVREFDAEWKRDVKKGREIIAELAKKENDSCPNCGNEYLAIRTDVYKDKREFYYCDCCGAMADKKTWKKATVNQ